MVFFLEKIGDKRCYIWDSKKKRIWDVITVGHGITQISNVSDYLCISHSRGVEVYDIPSLKLNQTLDSITVPYCVKPKSNIHWVGVSPSNGRLLMTHKGSHTPHENSIANICLDRKEGEMYATVSEKGTIVRVWKYDTMKKEWEGRRSLEPGRVVSMDMFGSALVLATSKGSVHYFDTNSKIKRGYMWDELPKSRYVWHVGKHPTVSICNETIYIADSTGLITIVSMDSGELLFQTSLLGDVSSPFGIPLA